MDGNKILKMDSWYEAFIEVCDPFSLNLDTDLNKENFITFFATEMVGERYVNDRNLTIKYTEDGYKSPTIDFMLDSLKGETITSYYTLTANSFANEMNDDSVMLPMIPSNLGCKLIKYNDLINKPQDLFTIYGMDYFFGVNNNGDKSINCSCLFTLYAKMPFGGRMKFMEFYESINKSSSFQKDGKNMILISPDMNYLGEINSLEIVCKFEHNKDYAASQCSIYIPEMEIDSNAILRNASDEYTTFNFTKTMSTEDIVRFCQSGGLTIQLEPIWEEKPKDVVVFIDNFYDVLDADNMVNKANGVWELCNTYGSVPTVNGPISALYSYNNNYTNYLSGTTEQWESWYNSIAKGGTTVGFYNETNERILSNFAPLQETFYSICNDSVGGEIYHLTWPISNIKTSTIDWSHYYFVNCNGDKFYLDPNYMYPSGTIAAYDEEGNFIGNLNATLGETTISFSNAGNNNLSDYAYVYLSAMFYGKGGSVAATYDPMMVWLYCSVNEDGTVSESYPRAILVCGGNDMMEFTDMNDDGTEIEISTLFPGNPSETVYIDQPGTPYGLSRFTSDIGFVVANGYNGYTYEISASDPNGQQPYYNNGVKDGQTVSLIPSSVQNVINLFYWNERFVQSRYASYNIIVV